MSRLLRWAESVSNDTHLLMVALHHPFATSTMRSRITPHSSRMVEPDGQLPRYGRRKGTAHQMASDDESHEDAFRPQSPPKRPKRTPTFTHAHSPSSRSSAKNRTIKGLGGRWTQKDQDKAWFAETILEESNSQCLIKYEPVCEARNVRYLGNRNVTQSRHLSHGGRSVRLEVPWRMVMLSVTTLGPAVGRQ